MLVLSPVNFRDCLPRKHHGYPDFQCWWTDGKLLVISVYTAQNNYLYPGHIYCRRFRYNQWKSTALHRFSILSDSSPALTAIVFQFPAFSFPESRRSQIRRKSLLQLLFGKLIVSPSFSFDGIISFFISFPPIQVFRQSINTDLFYLPAYHPVLRFEW